jgi:hypothetical protein
MRIARQDEAVAERHIFLHALSDLIGIADKRRAGPASDQADAGPEIGAHFELVALSAMQLQHALLANRIETGEGLLRRDDGLVVEL